MAGMRQAQSGEADRKSARMPVINRLKQALFPLHIHIATLFIGLILAVGLVLGWFNYHKNAEIILSASEQLFDQINQEIMTHFRQVSAHTGSDIDLLVLTPIVHAGTLPERLKALPLLATVLRDEPSLSAVQVGYDNGDYFVVRPLYSRFMRQRFQAPEGAVFVADSITADTAGNAGMLRIYFDQKLQPLERRQMTTTQYDPRKRDWYRQAMAASGIHAGKPYLYYFIQKVGLTVGRKSPDGKSVVAADITLDSLSDIINRHPVSPSAEVLVIDDDGKVLAYRHPEKLVVRKGQDHFDIAGIDQLGSPVLTRVSPRILKKNRKMSFSFSGRKWLGTVRSIDVQDSDALFLAIVAPEDELLVEATRISRENIAITVLILVFALPVAWLFAHKITRPLRLLSEETERIRQLDFSQPATTRSRILEIVELAEGMDVMKKTINKFLRLITSLAGEQDFDRMLHRIVAETLDSSGADGVGILLLSDDEHRLEPRLWEPGKQLQKQPLLTDIIIREQPESAVVTALESAKIQLVQVSPEDAGPFEQALLAALQESQMQMAVFPLENRRNQVIGILYTVYGKKQGEKAADPVRERLGFVGALSGFAAVSLETRLLLKSQKDLLEAFIKLIAGAIDAKSPYTGGHCQRVPELTGMLVEAASLSNEPPFQAFGPSEEDREAIHIAAWLHDCGKVTTPEYVVDKATKLETLYNRIHEIRTRFEVLKRDAQIRYWQAVADGQDRDSLRLMLEKELADLDDDFAFVAHCNQGGEFMPKENIGRLKKIAGYRWQRTLDDSIGLSGDEQRLRQRATPGVLPVNESVLADKPEHLVPRDEKSVMPEDNPWGFRLDVPEYKFNRGELYNLCVRKGTLTPEERYIINDHIVQTIIMLEQLPYPKHLRDVPRLAGAHHEKMDGSGYPRRLHGEDMPLAARIMAIADIFEAITASDRPYKKAKKLSEAIHIMAMMKQDHHIDPELFDLFLRSGVYRRYAEKYLSPGQIDDVDIGQYLS